MAPDSGLRRNEISAGRFEPADAALVFIGRIRTPWIGGSEAPRLGDQSGPTCVIEIFEPWNKALLGLEAFSQLEVLYWLDRSRRDLLLQSPANDGAVVGTFSLRSPVRPNPIGTAIVTVDRCVGNALFVRGLDCFDRTPLLDLKPERSLIRPIAPRK
jgi:tRNA-Thr(GGU) m(6)t(6)A37 methyltransferase TsaA